MSRLKRARGFIRAVTFGLSVISLVGCQYLQAGGLDRSASSGAVAESSRSTAPSVPTPPASTGTRSASNGPAGLGGTSVLMGDLQPATQPTSISIGDAESFQYVASSSGTAREVSVFLDGHNDGGLVVVGVYNNTRANHPGHLLTQGRIDSPRNGTWNTALVSPVALTTGEKYWITILAPPRSAAVLLRTAAGGGLAEISPTPNLAQLAPNWVPALTQSPLSIAAYIPAMGTGVPVMSSVKISKVSDGTATITWLTDRPATSQIRYGMTTSYGDETALDPNLVTTHTQVLGGLTPGTRFNVQAISSNPNGSSASSSVSFLTAAAPPDAVRMGAWSAVMPWPLVDVHMSLLYTGDVLMWDAWEFNGTPSVHLWNPNSQSWSPAFQTLASLPTLDSQMFCADQVTLPDGRLLVTGGHDGADIGIKNTMIFDPARQTWTPATDLNTARWYPTTIGLPSGEVIALGGEITPSVDANVPEVYNPAQNVWRPMPRATLDIGEYPLTYLMPNGELFVAAGLDDKSRILNLATQTWTTLGVDPAATGTAAMYRPGKILVSGGGTNGNDPVQSTAATIDLNQPSPTWKPTASMIYPRYKHNLVVLADGTVLAVGGSSEYSLVSQKGVLDAELWDPNTGSWSLMAAMHDLRMYHSTALLLPDGRVLVAGGGRMSPVHDYQTAEIYSPPYLFKGPRPTISDSPTSTTYGAKFTVRTPDANRIKSVALVGLGAVTHTFDSDQRYVPLPFTVSGDALTIEGPANANLAPPSYYMLFIVDSSGVPSVAKVIKVS